MKGHVPDTTPRLFTGLIAIINPDLTLLQCYYNLPNFSFANEIYFIWTEVDISLGSNANSEILALITLRH